MQRPTSRSNGRTRSWDGSTDGRPIVKSHSSFQYCPVCLSLQWVSHSEQVNSSVAWLLSCDHWIPAPRTYVLACCDLKKKYLDSLADRG